MTGLLLPLIKLFLLTVDKEIRLIPKLTQCIVELTLGFTSWNHYNNIHKALTIQMSFQNMMMEINIHIPCHVMSEFFYMK